MSRVVFGTCGQLLLERDLDDALLAELLFATIRALEEYSGPPASTVVGQRASSRV